MLGTIGKNAVKKGEIIFAQGTPVTQVGIILSGKVLMQNEWMKMFRTQGSFLALNDMGAEGYAATYTALEDCVIYALPYTGPDDLGKIVAKNGDYRAIMIASQFKYATDMGNMINDLYARTSRLYQFAKKSYDEYCGLCQEQGLQAISLEKLENINAYQRLQDMDEGKMEYYAAAAKIPLSANKVYFSYSEEMVTYQVMEIASLVENFYDEYVAMVDYVRELLEVVGLHKNHSLLEYACVQGKEMRRKGDVPKQMKTLLEEIEEELKYQCGELKKQIQNFPEMDFQLIERQIREVISEEETENEKQSREEKSATVKRDLLSLKNSMDQTIKYGELEEEASEKLKTNVDYLVQTPDRLSVEDDVKKAKKSITPIVFDLYLKCYRKHRQGSEICPKSTQLFLNFGMLDERLLEEEQLEFLCGIENEDWKGKSNVFTMLEWLDEIYEGRRDPSKSEFDEDYIENLRSLKKQGEITEEQQKRLTNDMDRRVEYEVKNMMMTNSKSLYGQPTSYVPILYKEAIYGYMDKILVSKQRIDECIAALLKIDYSAFYREVIYSNKQYKISNETIMKNVYPDIILFPLAGTNASMWQEVGNKNKATPGRFCFPIFCSTNIDDLMVKMFGRFRWELCRCIQGMAWNDVKVKSLTSEYMDYIQFYRKNRDLSDEAREKVKLQIQKGRNNSREIFLLDYEIWIKNESNGSMKLNKVARELLATYCPFEKNLRQKLGVQRPYELAMARSIRNALRKKQEFELKIKAIQKENSEVPEEVMETYRYYAD